MTGHKANNYVRSLSIILIVDSAGSNWITLVNADREIILDRFSSSSKYTSSMIRVGIVISDGPPAEKVHPIL